MIKVTCAILERKGLVLVTQRNKNANQALLWEFPGGKLEPNETEEQCLMREIAEELNLRIQPVQRLTPVVHQYGDRTIQLIPYICKYAGGELELRDHHSYQWTSINGLRNFNWCEADIPIVEEYLRLQQQL